MAALCVVLLLAGTGLILAPSRPAAAADRTIYITGHGKAHGVGVCMSGAWQMASTYGFGYRDIINYFYTGLDLNLAQVSSVVSDDQVRVGVFSAPPENLMHITCSGPFTVRTFNDQGAATDTPLNNTNVAVNYASGRYYVYLDNHPAPDFNSPYSVWVISSDSNAYPLGVYDMGYSFRGMIQVQYGGDTGQLWAVNQISVEYYLWGQEEEPSTSPTEFLKLTTVLMRTYAINHKLHPKHGKDGFDICATGDCQAYRGVNVESQQIKDAQFATLGQIATYGGQPIVAAYFSCCGGHTESYNWAWSGNGGTNPYPYLQGVPDPYCQGTKDYAWNLSYSLTDFQNILNGNSATAVGNLTAAYVSEHTPSGRAHQVTVTGSGGTKTVSGETFATVLGLRSNFFDIFDSNMSTECGTFAEGYTGAGFEEYLTLLNPDAANPAYLMVDYLFSDGTDTIKSYTVPAHTRSTISVNAEVGANREVSMRILGDRKVFAERPMYFNYGGWCTGGSDVAGTAVPAQVWYFAEGYTGPGFEEYLTLANPQSSVTHVDVTYMFTDGGTQLQGFDVLPHSRTTVRVNDVVGPGREVSMQVNATQPVTAERPMYFSYGGWTGGHTVAGLTGQPSTQFYFAEGFTGTGFDEYLTLANPQASVANVNIRYLFNGASPQDQPVSVAPHSRLTIKVNDVVGAGRDVSMVVDSSQAIVVERPMYFNYGGWCTGGSVAVGATTPATALSFAEGTTRAGFMEYLCIANPNGADAQVTLTYTFADGNTQPQVYTVKASTRLTVNVNADAGADRDVSIVLSSTQPVVAERPMYFSYGSWTGGHDAFGAP